jgi:DNA-binding IclR family transcriptional regulator
MATKDWRRLLFDLAGEDARAEIARRLPEFLSRGASTLEIARKTQAKPEDVQALLQDLEQHDVVRVNPSGLNISFGEELYSLTAEGVQFFKQLGSLKSRK